MTVDISKIRIGDRITVFMEVSSVGTSGCRSSHVTAFSATGDFRGWFSASDIATHESAPRPIVDGDQVRVKKMGVKVMVKAVDDKDQQAWFQWPDGRYGTLPLSVLELCEEGA